MIFLGCNGWISVFGFEWVLVCYFVDEYDYDLLDLSIYDDICMVVIDGLLVVVVIDDNVYVFSGLVDDFVDGLDVVDCE